MIKHEQITHDKPISSVWNYPLPEGLFEPDDRPEYRPYEPTPVAALNRNIGGDMYDSIQPHQQRVATLIRPLLGELAPESIPTEVRELAINDYDAGSAQRSVKALLNYIDWKAKVEDVVYPEAVASIEEGILAGTATPEEILYLLQVQSEESDYDGAELTKVAHPWGYRMEYVKDARDTVVEAITHSGGIVYPERLSPYRKVQLIPQFTHLDRDTFSVQKLAGFQVTYKRDIGHTQRRDGRRISIIERQAALLRVDEQARDIDQVIARKLREPVNKLGNWQQWLTDMHTQTGCVDYFHNAIQSDIDADFLAPLSTMTYAALESLDDYEKRIRMEQFSKQRIVTKRVGSTGMLLVDR